jgi:hypothetical protein
VDGYLGSRMRLKLIPKEQGVVCVLTLLSSSEYRLVAGICDHRTERSRSVWYQEFLTSWATIRFSGMPLLHKVIYKSIYILSFLLAFIEYLTTENHFTRKSQGNKNFGWEIFHVLSFESFNQHEQVSKNCKIISIVEGVKVEDILLLCSLFNDAFSVTKTI